MTKYCQAHAHPSPALEDPHGAVFPCERTAEIKLDGVLLCQECAQVVQSGRRPADSAR